MSGDPNKDVLRQRCEKKLKEGRLADLESSLLGWATIYLKMKVDASFFVDRKVQKLEDESAATQGGNTDQKVLDEIRERNSRKAAEWETKRETLKNMLVMVIIRTKHPLAERDVDRMELHVIWKLLKELVQMESGMRLRQQAAELLNISFNGLTPMAFAQRLIGKIEGLQDAKAMRLVRPMQVWEGPLASLRRQHWFQGAQESIPEVLQLKAAVMDSHEITVVPGGAEDDNAWTLMKDVVTKVTTYVQKYHPNLAKFGEVNHVGEIGNKRTIAGPLGHTPGGGGNAGHLDQGHGGRRRVVCWRCNQEGHIAQNCSLPDKRSCHSCGKPGHISRFCTTPCYACVAAGRNPCGAKGKRACRDPTNTTAAAPASPSPASSNKNQADYLFVGEALEAKRDVGREQVILDPGATVHCVNDLSVLKDVREVHKGLATAGGVIYVDKAGVWTLENGFEAGLAYYVPQAPHSLLSLKQLGMSAFLCHRTGTAVLYKGNDRLERVPMDIKLAANLWTVCLVKAGASVKSRGPRRKRNRNQALATEVELHRTVGHAGPQVVKMLKERGVRVLPVKEGEEGLCVPCVEGKGRRLHADGRWPAV